MHYTAGGLMLPVPDDSDPLSALGQAVRDLGEALDVRLGDAAVFPFWPVWTASGATNPNRGSTGLLNGVYTVSGGWVQFAIEASFGGSGIDPGVGIYRFDLPLVDPAYTGRWFPLGTAALLDASTGDRRYRHVVLGADSGKAFMVDGGGDQVTATDPWTWADGDTIYIQGRYPKDLS